MRHLVCGCLGTQEAVRAAGWRGPEEGLYPGVVVQCVCLSVCFQVCEVLCLCLLVSVTVSISLLSLYLSLYLSLCPCFSLALSLSDVSVSAWSESSRPFPASGSCGKKTLVRVGAGGRATGPP